MTSHRGKGVVIDLSNVIVGNKYGNKPPSVQFGNMTFDRTDNTKLELMLANELLGTLQSVYNVQIKNVTSVTDDPPDIKFEISYSMYGLEISEVLPKRLLQRENIISNLKKEIIAQLGPKKDFRNLIISVTLNHEDSGELKFHKLSHEIVILVLKNISNVVRENPLFLELSKERGRVRLQRSDLSEDPRIKNKNEPLILFSATNAYFEGDDEIRCIVEERLAEKFLYSFDQPTWLLLWTNHFSMHLYEEDIFNIICEYCEKYPCNYNRLFFRNYGNDKYHEFTRFDDF